jgi:hypothetical protein
MLLFASNSTSARPLILTVFTVPVMPANRRRSRICRCIAA